jgi:hypothetical protein
MDVPFLHLAIRSLKSVAFWGPTSFEAVNSCFFFRNTPYCWSTKVKYFASSTAVMVFIVSVAIGL